jgi:hypothetical protein
MDKGIACVRYKGGSLPLVIGSATISSVLVRGRLELSADAIPD